MGDYVPVTKEEQQEMLKTCGLEKMSDLYRDIPDEARLKKTLDLPEGKSELEVRRVLGGLAARNHIFPTIFRGAGAYRHYIPAIVDQVTDQEESLRTAYTPYQAEISQGVLQAIFEYQTDICELTGMDASNACVYDGATAAAEGCAMCRDRKRTKILAAATVDPKVLSVVKTYSFGSGAQVEVIPEKDGVLDQDALIKALTPDVACLLLQSPDYYGNIEEVRAIADAVHAAKAKIVLSMNPIAMAVLETNASMGRIVAAPTAGSAGVVPGVVLALDEAEKYEGARLRDALACAAAVGFVVSRNATVAGAEGGCQAEVGTASAMAAAAATQLLGGDARSCLAAASIAMGNLLGMVCDPIGGLVEDPCQKRNAAAAENALAAARMALAGVRPSAPFDEVVEAMRRVGAALPAELRETALGGLAACPSCRGCAGR